MALWEWWVPTGWRLPRLGWAGTEQLGWIAGIVGGAVGLASFVLDRLDARRDRGGSAAVGSVVRVGLVPQQAAWFQDRRAEVNLARAARVGRTAVLTQVLSGMGGVGKTQLAAQFARHLDNKGELDVLIWVTASSREAIIAAYAEAARAVGVVSADVEPEAAAKRMLAWLERTDRRWLVVLDNLDVLGEGAGWWPPHNRNGRTVVTTRRRDPVLHTDGRTLVQVDLFSPAEAVNYLTRATGATGDEHANIAALAADLGFLPLALAQAAAFIRDRGINIADYRGRLTDHRHPLADLAPPDDALPDDYQATVAATWLLSVEAADNHPPRGLARPVLDLAALLDPNGIPETLFGTDAVTRHLTAVNGQNITGRMAADALRNLHRLNLITHDPATGTVRVHALVQRATRDHGNSARLAAVAHAAADGLLALWPDIDRDPDHIQTLRANTAILQTTSDDSLLYPDAHPLLFRHIRSLGKTGQATAAATAAEHLLTNCLRVLGPEHSDTLTTRHNLANSRGEAGDSNGAAIAFEQLLTDRLRVLGPDHPDTLDTRGDLAFWRGQAGDSNGAAAAYGQLLTDCLRVLGTDHPHTLTTRHNLAHWRANAGDRNRVVADLKQLLTDCLRVLGPDHPDTLATRHSLAHWRANAGDPNGAVADLKQLLTDRLRVLGPDHPSTLGTRHSLAYWRANAGDPNGAIGDFEQLLTDRLRVLGPDHP
ncbi:tetratricopeptide repeat protein, partial [Micromonospora sp. NPDC005254]|uniref:tetratricopeptide repeat protein n=1 Tax=Micromonospora sp. NPDC005254 TaxID=3364229 RepID=UPI0036B62ED9